MAVGAHDFLWSSSASCGRDVWDWCCFRLGLGTSVFSFVVEGEVRRLRALFGGFGDGPGWNLGLWWMCLLWWEVVGGCSVVVALVIGIGLPCLLGSP